MTMTNNNPYKLCVAPMMGHTDMHFRYLLRLISKKTMLYTEMVATKTAIHGNRKKILSYSPEEKTLALQVGGSNKDELSNQVRDGKPTKPVFLLFCQGIHINFKIIWCL